MVRISHLYFLWKLHRQKPVTIHLQQQEMEEFLSGCGFESFRFLNAYYWEMSNLLMSLFKVTNKLVMEVHGKTFLFLHLKQKLARWRFRNNPLCDNVAVLNGGHWRWLPLARVC